MLAVYCSRSMDNNTEERGTMSVPCHASMRFVHHSRQAANIRQSCSVEAVVCVSTPDAAIVIISIVFEVSTGKCEGCTFLGEMCRISDDTRRSVDRRTEHIRPTHK